MTMRVFEDPKLELIRRLREAAGIEHAVMVQYLYAAFSVKPAYVGPPGFGAHSFLGLVDVANDTLSHLRDLNNLLVQLGCAPELRRGRFPLMAPSLPFELSLEGLSARSLAKHIYATAPRELFESTSPADCALVTRLAELLQEAMPPIHLGSPYESLVDLARAARQTETFVHVIQGISEAKTKKHHLLFRSLLEGTHESLGEAPDAWSLPSSDNRYPSLPVATNPTVAPGTPASICDPDLRALARVANIHYWIILAALDLMHRFLDPAQVLEHRTQALLDGCVVPLGQVLARAGVGLPFDSFDLQCGETSSEGVARRQFATLCLEADALEAVCSKLLPPRYT
ncbi:MAG: hypothetical protein JST92_07680, partial [Deltaproteobacteria bacterium]|nr:hypothetical protein [Deltaproteobacteria bacterium]